MTNKSPETPNPADYESETRALLNAPDGLYLPHADTDGIFTNIGDEVWATVCRTADLARENGAQITRGALSYRLKKANGIPLAKGLDANDRKRIIHPVDAILEATAELINCKITFPPTGIYIDEEGKKWATMNALERELQIPRKTIREHRSGIPTISGRQESEKEGRGPRGVTKLYDLEMMKKALGNILDAKDNTKAQVDKNGYYIDDEGITWLTFSAFWRDHAAPSIKEKMSGTTFKRKCKKLHSIGARNKSGIARASRPSARIYRLIDVQALANEI